MRLCVRLAVMAALLVALAVGLIWLRTDTAQAGNRLHMLFRQKRDLGQECCRLEMSIAALKNVARLRERAVDFAQDAEGPGIPGKSAPPERRVRPRPLVADRGSGAGPQPFKAAARRPED
jgi:cell division protein FtsL